MLMLVCVVAKCQFCCIVVNMHHAATSLLVRPGACRRPFPFSEELPRCTLICLGLVTGLQGGYTRMAYSPSLWLMAIGW